MISIKSNIQAALVGDAPLVALLGGANVYHQYPEDDTPAKFIIHYELDNDPLIRADEREEVSQITMAIEPYSDGNITDIALAIDRIITDIGGVRERAPDDDSEVPRNGKAMAYSFTVDCDGVIY